MHELVFLNGQFIAKEKAKISPFDRGFLFGDAIYEGVPIYKKQAFLLKEHYYRLSKNLNKIGIEQVLSLEKFTQIIATLVSSNSIYASFGIYFQISRGEQEHRSHKYPANIQPTIFACIQPTNKACFNIYKNGFIANAELDSRWHKTHIKATSLLANILHLQNDAIETILYDQSLNFVEGCSSNVFFVKDNTILTPPQTKNILPGITRAHLFNLAASIGIDIIETDCNLINLSDYEEAFITGQYKEILPIVKINEQKIGSGTPGKIWEKLFFEYKDTIDNLLTPLCVSTTN